MLRNLFFLVLCTPLFLNAQTAYISGNDTICDNASKGTVMVDFTGSPPFTFVYSINGVNQSAIITQNTPYAITSLVGGTYVLQNYNDAISVGTISGSALVTVLQSPTAIIHLASDTLSTIFPQANFISHSSGNIVSWDWNFGDNTSNISNENPRHTFPLDNDGLGIPSSYQIALIVEDINGCFDTATHIVSVNKEYWMYIPTSFTPDNDKKNDNFCIEYYGIRENTFLFKVYNVQGDLMYQSITPNKLRCSINGGWNGTYCNSSTELPSDTYVYEIYFQDFEGWKHKEYGNIFLIR